MADQKKSRLRTETGPKRIRTYVGGELVADTTAVLLVWETPYYPSYYIPRADVRTELLVPSTRTEHSPSRGEARYHSIKAAERVVLDAVWEYPDSPIEAIRDHLRFDWGAMDHWFEEDEEVIVHPRDPYRRVDVLASSRHVEVIVDGITVAESRKPTLLFETGLPTRYYLPPTDARLDLLEPSTTTTRCPYKGTASYYSVRIGDQLHEDFVWYYPAPLLESIKVAGLLCFYNERVDLVVDGVALERPDTPFR